MTNWVDTNFCCIKSQHAQLRISENDNTFNFFQLSSNSFSCIWQLFSVFNVLFTTNMSHDVPSTSTSKARSWSDKGWGTVKSSDPVWVNEIHMMSQLPRFIKDSGNSLGCQSVFMMVQTNRGDPFYVHGKVGLMFLQETSNKSSQAPVNMETDFVFNC